MLSEKPGPTPTQYDWKSGTASSHLAVLGGGGELVKEPMGTEEQKERT